MSPAFCHRSPGVGMDFRQRGTLKPYAMALFSDDLLDLARLLVTTAGARGLKATTAESCTGGLIAGCVTQIPGSSAVLERGFVTYSNEAKQDMLGVPEAVLVGHGAVSEPTARAMAEGALRASRADVAVSVTGVAGPGGGSDAKPVGLVHMAAARKGAETLHEAHRFGDPGRTEIQLLAVAAALRLLLRRLD
jgi:nicotinamide-nucleotide amidase